MLHRPDQGHKDIPNIRTLLHSFYKNSLLPSTRFDNANKAEHSKLNPLIKFNVTNNLNARQKSDL